MDQADPRGPRPAAGVEGPRATADASPRGVPAVRGRASTGASSPRPVASGPRDWRVQVQAPGRPGAHGKPQGRAYGLGAIAGRLGVAGASTMGLMSAYWSSKARLEYLDAGHFVDQVATMSQICGELMLADIAEIAAKT